MNSSLLLILAACVALTSAAKLPKNWKTCKRNDPNRNKCLQSAMQDALGDIMKGVPSLGVLPMDPLHLIRLELDSGNSNSPVAINLTFIDIDFLGFTNTIIKDVDFNWETGKLKAKTVTKGQVNLVGDYAINGKILLLPISGQGKCNITLTETAMDTSINGSMVQRDGKTYFHADKMDIYIYYSKVYMKMDNLFNGDKVLGDNMNKFVNENSNEVFEAFRGTIQKGLGEAFREIGNRVFDRVPFDVISPPN